ncbi:MAE_28990/MAE_18760 family HEPN-like nuclease [Vibrio alginolyticus]|nr:MAE_28990/MAE_18760 family HEPN-like nuclease [Vibrio alginolyticus]
MRAFTDEYDKRKGEIEAYITLLQALSSDGAKVTDIDDNESSISAIQQKVCKASCYLLIYNLVEATVMNGVQSIYNRIKDEGLGFSAIMDLLKKVWWHSKGESLTSTPKGELIETVYNYYCETHSGDALDFKDFVSGVSGNMDADGVRNVCHKYGIRAVADGRHLGNVKQYRNWLAHGNKSFSDIGQDVTVTQLIEIKSNVFSFLDEYVSNVNTYLDNQCYKATPQN